jgi:hypothetical protein
MKIQLHPRIKDIVIGDEVVCWRTNMYARVEEIFPAAVCVRLAVLRNCHGHVKVRHIPQLWRAEDIENISICRYCGSRDDLVNEHHTGIPYRICTTCRSVLGPINEIVEALPLLRQ